MDDTSNALCWWLALWRTPGVGAITFQQLLQHYPSPEALFSEAKHRPDALPRLSDRSRSWLINPDWSLIEQDLNWLDSDAQHHILCINDPDYPELLREIADPPPLLFVQGDVAVLQSTQLAMVGSRHASKTGQETAAAFAGELVRQGMVITSGLALGIDGAAHYGALMADGQTIAVAGTGLDKVYPARHQKLAEQIRQQGAIISEFPIGTQPHPGNFPRRNRIISGLSRGVLIIEAAIRSGSLITARQALEQGRDVFAIPGSIHNPLARGCNALLRDGAKLVETAADILEELGWGGNFSGQNLPWNNAKENLSLDEEYGKLLTCVGFEPTAVDTVVIRSGLTAEAVCSMLLVLELHGLVENTAGGLYCQTGNKDSK